MKRLFTYFALVFAACGIAFSACSKEEDGKTETGRIENMTDEVADVMEDMMKNPIEEALSVDEMARERIRGMDEALKD